MRSKLVLTLCCLAAVSAQARQLTPLAPLGASAAASGPTTGKAATAATVAAAPSASAPAAPAQTVSATTTPPAPGVVTLSDVAQQQGTTTDVPRVPAIQPAPGEVQAITLLDGHGQPIDVARGKLRPSEAAPRPQMNITLYRLSTIGDDVRAVLWVKGQYRPVVPGSRVLDYTVGEIREDGVCLIGTKAKTKAKSTKGANKAPDSCPKLLTFTQGLE